MRQGSVSQKARGKLTIECDELWSFVFSKEHKFYVWLVIDRKTREIVGCCIGDRSRVSAKKPLSNHASKGWILLQKKRK
jgi:hypothetical protein